MTGGVDWCASFERCIFRGQGKGAVCLCAVFNRASHFRFPQSSRGRGAPLSELREIGPTLLPHRTRVNTGQCGPRRRHADVTCKRC